MRFIFEIIRKILARVNYFLLIWKLIFSTAFKKIKYREKFKFLLITPEHCNLGDHAIAAAEEALFKDFFLFEITERSLDKFFKYFRHSLSLKLLFGKSDILIHGGGMNETYQNMELNDKDSVTFHKASVQFFPRFVWEVKPNIYVGTLLDFNYNYTKSLADWMKTNPAILKYGNRYHNIGIGALFQYDTRDDVATPFEGVFLSAMGTLYGKYLGGNYNYEMLELEYRQFRQVFKRRSTLAWTAKTQIGMDNVPYSELPNFGNPFDLRGYAWGKYRDKSMAYGIIEYRHMFMSQEAYARGAFWSKFGGVAWIGTGTIGKTPADWDKWKLNYGIGLRIQLQPRKNFRLDIGKEPGQKWGIYMNMTEAF